MSLDGRARVFVFFACVCQGEIHGRARVPPDLFSTEGLIRLSPTVFLTSLTWVIDWHDLHSNYLSIRSLGLAAF